MKIRFKIQELRVKNFFSKMEKGFTLVELLLYTGLFTILLVVLLEVFSAIIDVQLTSQSTTSTTQDGQYILARLSYDLGRATAITSPSGLGTTAFSLTVTISGNPVTFSLSNGNLDEGSTQLNGYDTTVSSFSVKRLQSTNGIDSITVAFTLTSKTKNGNGPDTKNFQTTISLRKP
ncbi:MAG TPA: prepilin-type N-terminal cleavage/methylation domain-containing protein [Patescibacteria group bacterium]